MTKENKEFNLEDRLIDFAVRIIYKVRIRNSGLGCSIFGNRSQVQARPGATRGIIPKLC